MDHDAEIRRRAFEFLDALRERHGGAVPRDELVRGFEFQGERVPLMGPQGIFKPRILRDAPLSITTAPIQEGKPRPYHGRPLSFVPRSGVLRPNPEFLAERYEQFAKGA